MDATVIIVSAAAMSATAAALIAAQIVRLRKAAARLEVATRDTSLLIDLATGRRNAEDRSDTFRCRAEAAEAEAAAYRETLERLGRENGELRVEILERAEEHALLETELAATKLALATEEGQADTWARTAVELGYSGGAPVAGAMGLAA